MPDDRFRIPAEVVDGFSGPLKALRAQLQGVANVGTMHTKTLGDGVAKVDQQFGQLAGTVTRTVNPALAAIGITGLGVGAAVAGIGASLRSLTTNLTGLGQLSRETTIAADQLRVLGSVARKFGIEQGQVEGSVKSFAGTMREFSRGTGEVFRWLNQQGRDAAGRKHFQDFAQDLARTKDRGQQLQKVIEELENIKDPVERGIFAEKFFGSADWGRLGDKHLGAIKDLFAKTREKLGPLDPKAIEQAERFDRSMRELGDTMQKIGTVLAFGVLPYAERFGTWLEEMASGKRADVTEPLRKGLVEIKGALEGIDWEKAGKAAGDFLRGTTGLATKLADAVRTISEVIKSLNEGKYLDAIGRLDGANGPLRRRLAPRAGDDILERNDQIARLRPKIETQREQVQLGKDLMAELEARGDRAGVRRQREAVEKNTEHLKDLEDQLKKLTEQGATVQQQSLQGGGLFGGATVQRAGLSGAARVGAMLNNRRGAISLPRGGAGALGGGLDERQFGRFLEERGIPSEQRGPMMEEFRRRRGAGAAGAGRALRGEPSENMPAGMGRGMLDLIAQAEGTTKRGYNDSYAHQLSGNLTDKTFGEIEEIQRGMKGSSAIGKYQFMRNTLFGSRGKPGLVDQLGIGRNEKFSPANQDRMATALIERRYQEARRAHARMGGEFMPHFRTALAREWASFPGDYGQQGINGGMYPGQRASIGRQRLTDSAQQWLDQREGRSTAATGPNRTDRTDGVDASGFAADYRRRSEEAQERRKILEPAPMSPMMRALRSGTQGATPNVNVNGGVAVTVDRAGPDARVRTSTSGDLFKEVKLISGRPMQEAN